MKKKNIYLIAGLVLVGLLVWLTVNLMSKRGKSDTESEMWDFAILDTAAVDRIIINEPNGSQIEIIRGKGKWTDKNGGCIQQAPVFNILEAAVNVRLKGYIQDGMLPNVNKQLASSAVEVKFYKNGEWHKTWYVGHPTPDHYGTFMLLDSEESGKSDKPVIMEIKGLNGIISPRFFADYRKWICTEIFQIEGRNIASVKVNNLEYPERSFAITKLGEGKYNVTAAGRPLPSLDTNMVTRYLNNYRNVHFEYVNSDLSMKQVDSLKKSKPFCEMTVKEVNGKSTHLRMFRRAKDDPNSITETDRYGVAISYDNNRFWCELPNGAVVKCQYFVFDPLLLGHVYLNYQLPAQKNAVVNR